MQQGIIFIFFMLFQIMVILQINIKIRVGYNFFTNKGKVKLSIFRKDLISSDFSFENGYIKTIKKNGKIKLIPIDVRKQSPLDYIDYMDFSGILFKKMYLKRVNFYVNYGNKESAFATSLVTGFSNAVVNAITSIVSCKKRGVLIKNKSYGTFNKDYLKINCKASASISIFDMFWCVTEYLTTKKRSE